MIRTHLGRSRVRESRMLGSVGAKLNGLATRPSPIHRRQPIPSDRFPSEGIDRVGSRRASCDSL